MKNITRKKLQECGRKGGLAPHPNGRGHWTAGKRRNDPGVTEQELRAILSEVWAISRQAATPRWGQKDPRAIVNIAHEIGVTERTVRRWLRGKNTPQAVMVHRMKKWLENIKKLP